MTPYFKSMSEFIAMGDHGYYVWLCYALTVIAILGLIIYTKMSVKLPSKNSVASMHADD